MSRPRRGAPARTPDGDLIVACPGCGAWPVRDSWLEPHACGLRVCRVCREEGGCVCLTQPEVGAR